MCYIFIFSSAYLGTYLWTSFFRKVFYHFASSFYLHPSYLEMVISRASPDHPPSIIWSCPELPPLTCIYNHKTSSQSITFVLSLVVIKLPYLFSTILVPELSKGMGHHSYGEPAWPNDILYIFPIVIFGIRSYILGLAIREPLNISSYANPFGTPFQILAEWYLFPTLHLLRILSDKFMGILSILAVPTVLLLIPFGENLSRYQNPIRRPIMVSIFLSALIYSIWLSCISFKLTG